MDVGDIVLAKDMKRYIVIEKIEPPSLEYQIVEHQRKYDSDWVKLVCIRSGNIILYPTTELRYFKICTSEEYVQAIENVRPEDRVQLDPLKVFYKNYKCFKRDADSIFINRR